MLSPSPSKITDLAIPGASLRPADRAAPLKTAKHEGMDQMDPPSPKLVAALLREARSVSRRADKLGADVAAVQDPTIQQLAAQASGSIDQLDGMEVRAGASPHVIVGCRAGVGPGR